MVLSLNRSAVVALRVSFLWAATCCLTMPVCVSADVVCPDSSYVTVTFTRTYTGEWMTGQPYDYVTIAPNGAESFADMGIEIDVYVRDCQGEPIVGLPAEAITITSNSLCLCVGGNFADGSTDSQGRTTFRGKLKGGGFATTLDVECDGVAIGALVDEHGTTVKVNSPVIYTYGCHVDAGDLAAFSAHFGEVGSYTIALDLNETGPPTIDASDLAYFARVYRQDCDEAP